MEAACNPLIASIFPDKKTKMLNKFHVWFPGGIVIGGVLAWLLMDNLNLRWEILVGLLFIPLAIYGYLFFGQTIPETERVAKGVSYKEMLRNVGAPFTIIATVVLMILMASIPSLSVNFDSIWPYIIVGVIVVLVIIEGKGINKINSGNRLYIEIESSCLFSQKIIKMVDT